MPAQSCEASLLQKIGSRCLPHCDDRLMGPLGLHGGHNVVVGILLTRIFRISSFDLILVPVLDCGCDQRVLIGIIFTAVSTLRIFTLRQLFEAIWAQSVER